MKCPKCATEQQQGNESCVACGLVFHKYEQYQQAKREKIRIKRKPSSAKSMVAHFLPPPKPTSLEGIYARAALLALLIYLSLPLIWAGKDGNAAGESFLHLINLPFHEAGHVFFGVLGQFIGSLGGTLGQFIMPGICCYVFWVKQDDPFATSVAFWWFAENFLDIAPYINDARAGVLPLLGGNIGKHAPYGFHDWEFLLTELGLLRFDRSLAFFSHALGSLLMLLAIAWGAILLHRQYQVSREQAG